MTNRHGRRTSAERGVAAVEFALLLPVLLLFLLGIIEFGKGYNAKITLTHAAAEGVRVAFFEGEADGIQAAQDAAGDLHQPPSNPVNAAVTNAECADPTADVVMVVSRDVSYRIPFFGTGTFALSETATWRCGG